MPLNSLRIIESQLNQELYQYPEHLRPFLEQLPKKPGVYFFHGTSDTLPLYIGKSVNIRSRVMSHFRCQDEAKLLHQTQRITFIETAGELGALLMEARFIKQQQPLFNKRLRRSRQLCSFRLTNGQIHIVFAKAINFATTAELYGLFSSRTAAMEKLRSMADKERLCYGLLGIEKVAPGRACFRFALKRCGGACCGAESQEAQFMRLEQALSQYKLDCWPYPGRIALIEEREHFRQYHIIHHWLYLGTVATLDDADRLQQVADYFDSDGYKILCGPIIKQAYPIIPLDPAK